MHQYHDDAAHRQKAVQFARQGAQQGECHTEPEEQQHPIANRLNTRFIVYLPYIELIAGLM